MKKTMETYQNNWSFEQTYRFRTLIYYGNTIMVLWKKLWYYTKNYETLIYYGKKLWYYGKNYGTIVNYGKL